jgi:hypothetical protein
MDGAVQANVPALAKHGDARLRLIAGHPPDHYLLPMDQGDAEILERIDAGQRVFVPAAMNGLAPASMRLSPS